MTTATRAWVLVALGGMIGAGMRGALTMLSGRPEPHWVLTLSENLVGALLLGILLAALPNETRRDNDLRLLLGTGMLGSLTTFSALSAESVQLGLGGGALLMTGSLLGGLIFVAAGLRSGRTVRASLARQRASASPAGETDRRARDE